jgi:hypothetical protein
MCGSVISRSAINLLQSSAILQKDWPTLQEKALSTHKFWSATFNRHS